MVMVKPGMPYLDILQRVSETFGRPTFASRFGRIRDDHGGCAERLARRERAI